MAENASNITINDLENTISEIITTTPCCSKCEFYNCCFGNKNICSKEIFIMGFKQLNPREQRILLLKYGWFNNHKYNDVEISQILNLSEGYMKQQIEKAIDSLSNQFYLCCNTKALFFACYNANQESFYLSAIQALSKHNDIYFEMESSIKFSIDYQIVDQRATFYQSITKIRNELSEDIYEINYLNPYNSLFSKLKIKSLRQLLYTSLEILLEAFDYDDNKLYGLEILLNEKGFNFKERSLNVNFENRLVNELFDSLKKDIKYDINLSETDLPSGVVIGLLNKGINSIWQLFNHVSKIYGSPCVSLDNLNNYLLKYFDDLPNIEIQKMIVNMIDGYFYNEGYVVSIHEASFVVSIKYLREVINSLAVNTKNQKISIIETINTIKSMKRRTVNSIFQYFISNGIIHIFDLPFSILFTDEYKHKLLYTKNVSTFNEILCSDITINGDYFVLKIIFNFILNHRAEINNKSLIDKAEKIIEICEGYESSMLYHPIEELDLSVRSYMCLKRNDVNTVYDIINYSEDDMMKIRNLGRKNLDEITEKIKALGFSLKDSDNE